MTKTMVLFSLGFLLVYACVTFVYLEPDLRVWTEGMRVTVLWMGSMFGIPFACFAAGGKR